MSYANIIVPSQGLVTERRAFLSGLGKATLSASAVALIVGCESIAQGKSDMAADVAILNVALGLEHEGITAYQLGAESGLLQKPILDVAVMFKGHHEGHREVLMSAIRQMGGTPVAPKTKAEYAKDLKADTLKNQTDVLRLAQRLELGAVNAYLGVMPSFGERALAQVAGRLVADETMHWTVLTSTLGQPLPGKSLTFGA